MKSLAFTLPLALLAAGCTAVGPDYAPPESAASADWIESADARAIDPRWWDAFGDPLLAELIERALHDAPDIAEASARLAEARANRDAVLGGAAPQLTAKGSASENRISEDGQIPVANIPGFDPEYSLFDLGFDASWEIDFWGRRTREAEGARARVEAAIAGRREAMVMLSGEIARAYMDLRGAQAEAQAAGERAAALGELARLTQLRYRAGESNRIEADKAAAEAQAAQSAVPQLRAQAAAAAYRIAALLGEAPETLVPSLIEPAPVPDAPETILAGLRSDLLRRRPDVRRAERELAAVTADIGVATADLFPRFSLIGGVGTQSQSTGGLFSSESLRFSVGPSFSWPIFSGGRIRAQIRAQIRAADARADAAAARYEKAVAGALADSEGAVNRYLRAQEAEQAARAALAEERSAFALATRRYEAGEDDRLALERARMARIEGERRFDAARAETARAAAALFKSLGGGWQAAEEEPGGAKE